MNRYWFALQTRPWLQNLHHILPDCEQRYWVQYHQMMTDVVWRRIFQRKVKKTFNPIFFWYIPSFNLSLHLQWSLGESHIDHEAIQRMCALQTTNRWMKHRKRNPHHRMHHLGQFGYGFFLPKYCSSNSHHRCMDWLYYLSPSIRQVLESHWIHDEHSPPSL